MDSIVIKAYRQAKSKDFLAITTVLEKLLRREHAEAGSRYSITTRQVCQVLKRNGLEYQL